MVESRELISGLFLGDVREATLARQKIADIFRQQHHFDSAIRDYRKDVLPGFYKLGAKRDLVNALIGLANVFIDRSEGADIRRAEESLNEALPLAEEMKIPQTVNIKQGLNYCKQLKKRKRGRR